MVAIGMVYICWRNLMMKKRIIGILAIVVIIFTTFRVGMVAGATNSTPGTSSDPLITQSYLEKRLSELGNGNQLGAGKTVEAAYKKVSVTKGKQLIVEEGSEFAIYSGAGSIIGDKGVMNLSAGEIVKKGNQTSAYQNYLSLSASSGIKATQNCIIYVKGSYTIKG